MVHIEIETDNAAFADSNLGPELGRILRKLAAEVTADPYRDGRKLLDANGNTVGRFTITVEEEGGRS